MTWFDTTPLPNDSYDLGDVDALIFSNEEYYVSDR